ncbi:diacylglycerol acyltransferase-domain-containing protein [Whalleya microplaca]|nr:diacylglycerol acyltransferase-domain-containing protein [Whalleya microplaca]
MAGDKSPAARRRGLSTSSQSSKLPQPGQSGQNDNVQQADPSPSSRLCCQPKRSTPDLKATPEQSRQGDSRSTSAASLGSSELPSPVTPPNRNIPVTKSSTPRIAREDHICSPKPPIPPKNFPKKKGKSTTPATPPGPELSPLTPNSVTPKGFGNKGSPSRHVFRRKLSKAKEREIAKMSNEPDEKPKNVAPEAKEVSETPTAKPEPQGSEGAPKVEPPKVDPPKEDPPKQELPQEEPLKEEPLREEPLKEEPLEPLKEEPLEEPLKEDIPKDTPTGDPPKEDVKVQPEEQTIKAPDGNGNGNGSVKAPLSLSGEKEEHSADGEDQVKTAVEEASAEKPKGRQEERSDQPEAQAEKLSDQEQEDEPAEKHADDYRSTDDRSADDSALQLGFNGRSGNISSLKSLSNDQDDDDSYPELDDMTVEELHPPPRSNIYGGIRWAPWNVPLTRRLQTLVLLMHCMCIGALVSVFFAFCANPFTWPLLLMYLLHVLSSKAATDGSLKYRSEWFRKSYIWHLFAGYFPAKLHKTHDLPPTRKYIFGYHPHGIISHGAWAAFGTEALGFSEKYPGITNSLLTLDSNFRIPFYREYILAAGMRSVSKESIVNILTKGGPNGEGMGRAVTIVVGGARESLEAQPGMMRLILKERKGFVKIAVRTGADLVPVLAFGENNLYDQLQPHEHPVMHKIQMFVLKVWKFTLPFLHGRGIFNYDVGLMPYRRPLNVVVGAPIKVTQSAVVDQAEINRLHGLYVAELEKLWDRYKDEFALDRKEELQILP